MGNNYLGIYPILYIANILFTEIYTTHVYQELKEITKSSEASCSRFQNLAQLSLDGLK